MVALKDRFPPSTQDAEWIGKLVGDGDWIIVSGDNRILKNKHEIERLQVALNHNQNKCNELTKNNITTLKSNKQLEIIIRKEKEEFSKIKMEYQATEKKNKAIKAISF